MFFLLNEHDIMKKMIYRSTILINIIYDVDVTKLKYLLPKQYDNLKIYYS